jgi:hypothetical protein
VDRRRRRLAAAGENVENDVAQTSLRSLQTFDCAMDALAHGFGAGGFDSGQPVFEHGGENLDHLPVAFADKFTQSANT